MEVIPDEMLASEFYERIMKMAKENPHVALYSAVQWALSSDNSSATPSFADPTEFGKWAYENLPLVAEYLKDNKTILAIKELRKMTYCGLKEAKDAVEHVKYKILGMPYGGPYQQIGITIPPISYFVS